MKRTENNNFWHNILLAIPLSSTRLAFIIAPILPVLIAAMKEARRFANNISEILYMNSNFARLESLLTSNGGRVNGLLKVYHSWFLDVAQKARVFKHMLGITPQEEQEELFTAIEMRGSFDQIIRGTIPRRALAPLTNNTINFNEIFNTVQLVADLEGDWDPNPAQTINTLVKQIPNNRLQFIHAMWPSVSKGLIINTFREHGIDSTLGVAQEILGTAFNKLPAEEKEQWVKFLRSNAVPNLFTVMFEAKRKENGREVRTPLACFVNADGDHSAMKRVVEYLGRPGLTT